MAISSISDVHIKKIDDESYQLLMNFLNHKKVQESEAIFLLGDIFDLMVGGYSEYIEQYLDLFTKIAGMISDGKTIYFIEGNHDFHLIGLFQFFEKKFSLPKDRLKYSTTGVQYNLSNKRIHLSHGDDFDQDKNYKRYKKIIKSGVVSFLLERIFTHSFVSWVGNRASEKSRNKNIKKYSNTQSQVNIRDNFREWVGNFAKEENYDVIVCGHSHFLENYRLTDRCTYLNNGFIPSTKKFVYITDDSNTLENI